MEYYGTWSADYGLNISKKRSLSNVMRRKNFRAEPLTTSIVITDNKTKTDLLGLRYINFTFTFSKHFFSLSLNN